MNVQEIIQELNSLKKENKSLFMTSSFQTQSLPLLHIISQLEFKIPVFYLNTGFLFPETLTYIKELQELFHFDVRGLSSNIAKINQRDENGNFLFVSDPDYCCHINKIKPLEATIAKYDVWISGVRADQSANRAQLKKYETSVNNKLRFHPMLAWNRREVYQYISEHKLPKHPLEKKAMLV